MDLRALARQLGAALKETPEYNAVQTARAKVEQHEAARIMLRDFRRRETEYRQAVLEGKATDEQAKELRNLAEIIGCNPYLRELIAAESALAGLVMELQGEITAAAGLTEPAAGGGRAEDEQGG